MSNKTVSCVVLSVCLIGLVAVPAKTAQAPTAAVSSPAVDHHQHLFSPPLAALISTPTSPVSPIAATDLIARLDAAGIKRAAVFSVAYIWANPNRAVADEQEKVRAENDWTSQQVAQFPERLIGFCAVNPLRDYALEEMARCAKDPQLRRGLKLHMGNSVVDYNNPAHVERLRAVFAAANRHGMAIVVHMRASISQKVPYDRESARVFLEQILPAAPDVPVQIAHLAGAGGYSDPLVDEALQVFVDAIAAKEPRTRNLLFDVTTVVTAKTTPERATLIVSRIRQLGIARILYGSDATSGGNPAPREGWALFRQLPLTEAEFATIAAAVAPYMK